MEDEETQDRRTYTVDEVCEMFGVSTWSGYEAIKAGTFPVPVLRVGRRIVVPRRPVDAALGIAG